MAKINEFFNNYIFSVESANKVVEFINLNVSLEKNHIIKLIIILMIYFYKLKSIIIKKL